MTYLNVALFLLEGQSERFMGISDDVLHETGSEAARAGAVCILMVISVLMVLLGLLMLILAAPFYVAWAVVAMLWVGGRGLIRVVQRQTSA